MSPAAATFASLIPPKGGPVPPNVTSLFAWVISNRKGTVAGSHGGTGDSFSVVTAGIGTRRQTLTDAAAAFVSDDGFRRVNIAGSGSGNNGNFYVSDLPSGATTLRFIRPVAAGAIEAAYTGNWSLSDKYSQIVDLKNGRVFSNSTVLSQPAKITEFGSPVFNCIGKAATNAGAAHSWLECSDAAVTGFQTTDISLSARIRIEGTLAGGLLQFAELHNSAFPTSARVLYSVNASRFLQLVWGNGAATIFTATATTGALAFDTWYTVGLRLNQAANTCTFFLDGVNKETSAAGTARNPVLNRLYIGESTSVGTSSSGAFIAGMGCAPVGWSDAEFLAVHNTFLAYGVPT